MASEISRLLTQLEEKRAARRSRATQIREDSELLLARTRLFGRRELWSTVPHSQLDMKDRIEAPQSAPALPHPGGNLQDVDVLDQVQALLGDADRIAREQWSEDDTLILRSLQHAWSSARRKGYAIADLHAILTALARTPA